VLVLEEYPSAGIGAGFFPSPLLRTPIASAVFESEEGFFSNGRFFFFFLFSLPERQQSSLIRR